MLRKDIINGFKQVLFALEECKIVPLIQKLSGLENRPSKNDQEKEQNLKPLELFRKWVNLTDGFNKSASEIMSILGLDVLDLH